MMDFIESYMLFRFGGENTFLIERSTMLKSLSSVKACECVTLADDRVCLIEAKSSAPSPMSKKDFSSFIHEVSQKFIDSLLLFNAILLERHGRLSKQELPSGLYDANPQNDYSLYLIVHGHKEE